MSDHDGARVAVVGTGRMGAAMASRLVAAGFSVTVYNRTASRAEEVAAATGATVVATARGAAETADVVVVSLADDAAVRSAYQGADGVIAGLRAGSVVADTSTVDPDTLRELAPQVAAAGAELLDTPVSGSVATVAAGQLLVMAGGDPDALERATPVLEAFSRRIIAVGPLGAGATMKLVVNAMVHAVNGALAEALVLAERSGVARELAYEVIASSAVAAPFVLYKRQAYEHPEGTPVAFTLDLVAKDLDLAAALASRVAAPMPQLAANRAVVEEALAAGFGAADLSALAVHLRRSAGSP